MKPKEIHSLSIAVLETSTNNEMQIAMPGPKMRGPEIEKKVVPSSEIEDKILCTSKSGAKNDVTEKLNMS